MFKVISKGFLIVTAVMLAACSKNNPGPLEGTWRMADPIPLTITFRKGEAESLGMIDKVEYRRDGNDVIVTWKTGFTAGTAMRYTFVSNDVVHTELGTIRRVRR